MNLPRISALFSKHREPGPEPWAELLAKPDTAPEVPVRGVIELITDEEVRAYLILREVGWATLKIARAMRRSPESVAAHIARRDREMRIAREMREIRA